MGIHGNHDRWLLRVGISCFFFFSCFGFQYCFWRQCIFTTQKEHGKVSGLSSYSGIKTKKEN